MDNIKFFTVEYFDGEYSIQSKSDGGGYMLDLPRSMNREEALLFCMAANATLQAIGMYDYSQDK